jgi:mycofactocin biosynthetic radical S-adenosylmethionine protein MftC
MNHADWPLSAPVNLTWEITHQCNLRCVHCLSGSNTEMPGELGFAECLAIVDELASLHVFEVNFGGGEPLLKSFFLPLLRYIHQKGIVTCISTNGTMLSDEAVACFTGNPLVNIQVSLDGATPEVNDHIRGEGTFHHILRGVELLSGRNIPLSINTVVTSLNFQQLPQIKELAGSFGARLRVSRFRPSGRARASWDSLRLTSRQLQELTDWLNQDPTILTGDSFFSVSGEGRRQLGLNMCGACKLTCCIDPCGHIYPCAFLQESEFCGGSLKETSLQEIWDKSAVFINFRQLEPASCVRCPRFNICRGGCPAVAYFVRKDLDSADPECLVNWKMDISRVAG